MFVVVVIEKVVVIGPAIFRLLYAVYILLADKLHLF